MGKKKTFGRASKYELLDWAQESDREITVTEHGEGYLYGHVEVDGRIRQIRLSSSGDFYQICDADFDRWANSVGAEARFPSTQAQFDEALEHLCSIPLKKLRADRDTRLRV